MNCYIVYLYNIARFKEKKEVTFPLCSCMCFMSIKLSLNGPCKVMAKVAHFLFTTYHSKAHNFHTWPCWPWNDTILKSPYTQENYDFGHQSVIAVLCLLFCALKKLKLYNFFRHNLYLKPITIRIRVRCIGYDRFILKNEHLKKK